MSKIPLGPLELGFIAIYLLSLIGIGYLGMRARTENSLKDFYLAGSGVGFMVLVLTLYATQYSGNTLFAFTGKTFRIGYPWLMSVHFMTSIIVVYLVFAPRLHSLAKRKNLLLLQIFSSTDLLIGRTLCLLQLLWFSQSVIIC